VRVATGPGCGPEDAARPVLLSPAAALPAPAVYRFCRCGGMHRQVPCEESEAREEQRAAVRVRLEAEKKPRKKARA
jgi:hypothetical protein